MKINIRLFLTMIIIFLFAPDIFPDQTFKEKGLEITICEGVYEDWGGITFTVKIKNTAGGPKSLSGEITVFDKGSGKTIGTATVFIGLKPHAIVTDSTVAFLDSGKPGKWKFTVKDVFDFVLEDDKGSDTAVNAEDIEDDPVDDSIHINKTDIADTEIDDTEKYDTDDSAYEKNIIDTSAYEDTGIEYYYIIAKHSGYCMEAGWASTDEGTQIFHQSIYGGDNEIWSFQPAGGEYYYIVNKKSSLVVTVKDGSKNNLVIIQQEKNRNADY
jgi:hypothetical protein